MILGWQRLCISVGLVVLAGCASVRPEPAQGTAARTTTPPAATSAAPVADATTVARVDTPVLPVIPAPVPVDVAPTPPPITPEAEAEIAAALPAEPLPVAPVEPGDLLNRIRSGLSMTDIRNSRIDTEANWFVRNPQYIERLFERAAPYLHYIVSQVEARGLPMELALLPTIESAFQPYAYSRARADGLWQFIPSTGGRFGLKQDWWYDGRRDVVAATRAALDYLTYLNEMFEGNWLHAIAAYNCGEGNVSRAIRNNRAAGKPTDFWNLKLPSETRAYVPRLLAMSRIVAEPELFGLGIEGMPDLPYFKQVETGGQISMEVAAELAGITTQEMYELNPAYHRWATDPTGPHALLVPVESAEAFSTSLLLLTPDQRMRVERYTVRAGDTVTSIAQRFGTTAQHLRELNELGSANAVQAGAELRVPSAAAALPTQVLQAAARVDNRNRGRGVSTVHVVRRGDTLSSIAKRYGMSVSALAKLNRISSNSTIRIGQKLKLHADNSTASSSARTVVSGDGKQVTYVVRRGDTLTGIARTLRVTVSSLREWNNLSGSDIRPGQKLVIFVPSRS